MDHVTEIFEAFGGPAKLARAVNLSMQTVSDWKVKGKAEIPPWRRPAVLAAMATAEKPLSIGAIEYLQSTERAERTARAA